MAKKISKKTLEKTPVVAVSVKKSTPELIGDTWRVRHHNGQLSGYYSTEEFAQEMINSLPHIL